MGLRTFINSLKYVEAKPATIDRAAKRQMVAKYSRGNVLLQQGRYVTGDEVARRVKELANYDFSA